MPKSDLKEYRVWDKPTRWFHWINAISVLGLIGLGLIILYAKEFQIGPAGKILLKEVHIWFGYVFAINLFIRLIWAFFGNRYSNWRGILPGGKGYVRAVQDYIGGASHGQPKHYLGHNPLGRLSVTLLFALLFAQAVTGLVLAGTDIFFAPFGHWIAQWIAADGVDPSSLLPGAKEMYDPVAYDEMRAFRKPFITTHYYAFYAISAMVVLHILAVVVTEIRSGGALVSAMFTGRKILSGPVEDGDVSDGEG
ncbi:cytochrome b561 [Iodidimonas gelatinilytica]|uniref:Cytochrome b561 n=1 Tax=Iodidimonas gelatinilytica TaxID=1236966 RepID=A0A5A7MYV0_9PROT|nr:cytochrome b/b6 domain-containing protein [Iodidimonas gelatinilytica]GER00554.1 cytochrome b561 [Iodidimonas gelatinilytica]